MAVRNEAKKQARKVDQKRWKPGKEAKRKQEIVLGAIRLGATIDAATAEAGVSPDAYKKWRQFDPSFVDSVTRVRAQLANTKYPPCEFTPANRAKLFAQDYDEPINPPHLAQAMELINSLRPGEFGLILMPPEHAKTSLGEDWLSCALADNAETRSVVISKTQTEAIKRLLRIQSRMEDRDFYPEYIDTYGPFKPVGRTQRPWAATKMTIARKSPRQRDYSLQAIGIGGQVQGQRIDKVLLDDIEDDQNFRQHEDHANYIRQSVNTRLGRIGIGLMIGTRQDEMDVYRQLMDEDFFDKVLVLPATFEDGATLWPHRYSEDDYARMERKAGPRVWAMTYQQEDVVTKGATFPLPVIESCYDKSRSVGDIPRGTRVVVGIDPAPINYTAGVVIAVDPKTGRRFLVDVWNETGLTGDGGEQMAGIVQFIVELVKEYRANICVIERNAQQTLITTSLSLRSSLTDLNCGIVPFFSGREDDLAIQQLSALFTNQMISIPAAGRSKGRMAEFVKQLARWRAQDKKLTRDIVKAFQFAEFGARRFISPGGPDDWGPDTELEGDDDLPRYLRQQRQTSAV